MTATAVGITRAEALAQLNDPNTLVVSVEVPVALTGTSTWLWYGPNAPVAPIRLGRKKLWRTSELRQLLGLHLTPDTPPGGAAA